MSKKEFVPIIGISTCDFANGTKLRIDQVNLNGACAVLDITGEKPKIINHTRSVEKTWASVRYSAGILNSTQRSVGAPVAAALSREGRAWT